MLAGICCGSLAPLAVEAQEPTPGNEMTVVFGDNVPAKAPPRPDGEGA